MPYIFKDCDAIYDAVLDLDKRESDNYILFKFAHCIDGGYDIHKLIYLLNSDDDNEVSDAIFITRELSKYHVELLPSIKNLMDHNDEFISKDAAELFHIWSRRKQ